MKLQLLSTLYTVFSNPKGAASDFMLRIGGAEWSNVLAFSAPSGESVVTHRSASSQLGKLGHVGISWTFGLGKYILSKIVTFAPRYMIQNGLSREILFRAGGDACGAASLQPGAFAPITWFAAGCKPAIELKYSADAGSTW